MEIKPYIDHFYSILSILCDLGLCCFGFGTGLEIDKQERGMHTKVAGRLARLELATASDPAHINREKLVSGWLRNVFFFIFFFS